MSNIRIISSTAAVCLLTFSCTGIIPETKVDLDLTDSLASISYSTLKGQGIEMYNYLPDGFNCVDGAMMASATDEADYAIIGSDIEKMQIGSWNSSVNPLDNWSESYRGIRCINLFLKNSEDYRNIILRDTSTSSALNSYLSDCADIQWLREEAEVMRAYIYFELSKRYGDVPIVDSVYYYGDSPSLGRVPYDDVIDYCVERLDKAIPNLQESWYSYANTSFGRIDKGTAMSLKSRMLLYWASPQHNVNSDVTRWEKAAQAAKDIIALGKYTLSSDYQALFVGANTHKNSESIYCHMTGENNHPEADNYPVYTNGGGTGTCPSANLVDEYENIDGTPFSWDKVKAGEDPYSGRDPRLQASIVVNNSVWNDRTIQCYVGGTDGEGTKRCSTTGYYLKKFLTDGLNLELNQKSVHSWVLFRYAEILLNYAEAMNEAYGPDTDHYGDGQTARWAVNQVRSRSSMPGVVAVSKDEMRFKIKHERQIELAFEDHRFWDVHRWGETDAQEALGGVVYGTKIVKDNDGGFTYSTEEVENRSFSSKMMLFPIPQSEINKSNGTLTQNIGW